MFIYIDYTGTVQKLTQHEFRNINRGDYRIWEHNVKGEKPLQVIFRKGQRVDLHLNGVSQSNVAANIFSMDPENKSDWLICHTNRSIIIESCHPEDVRNAVKYWHPGIYVDDFVFYKVLPNKVYVLAIKDNYKQPTKMLNEWEYYIFQNEDQSFKQINFTDLVYWEKIING